LKKTDFSKLQAKWYKKLEKDGFQDIEKNEYQLKQSSSIFMDMRKGNRNESSATVVSREAKRDYYMMATDFLNSHPFTSKLQRIIWEYHANGLSTREISATLNKVRKNKILRMTVWRILKQLSVAMKQKYGVTK